MMYVLEYMVYHLKPYGISIHDKDEIKTISSSHQVLEKESSHRTNDDKSSNKAVQTSASLVKSKDVPLDKDQNNVS